MSRLREAVRPVSRIPPPRAPRKRGEPKKAISVKAPEPLKSYAEEMEKAGHELSDTLVNLCVFAIDCLTRSEPYRYLMEHEAMKRGTSLGVAAAELIIEQLQELYPDREKPNTKR